MSPSPDQLIDDMELSTPWHQTPEARAMRGEKPDPNNYLEEMEASGFISKIIEKHKYEFSGDKKTSAEEVASALSYISADLPNQDWVVIGMAIKEEFGDSGFDLWNDWSSKGEKYKPREMRVRWNSFGRREGVTIGTLFHMARESGWSPIFVEPDPISDFVLNGKLTGWRSAPTVMEEKKIEDVKFPLNLLDAPGLVGHIATFINRTSLLQQPVLALGSAIAAAGTLMGRKVRSDTNLRTNTYIIGLAPSGSGKDHARTIIKRILQDSGMGALELGVPASSAGLITGLRSNGEGRGIILWDEFGRTLQQISGWKSGSHEKDIITALVELFSSAQSTYTGKQYANHDGKNPMKPIDQPCLSIYATSVPGRFYEALSGGEAIDGFLSRWLLFESKDYSIEEESRDEVFAEIPQNIIDLCKVLKAMPFNSEPNGGNLADATRVVPKLIRCSEPATQLLKDFSSEMRKRSHASELACDNTASIWARAGEHARRLALIGHEGDEISIKVAEWGINTARYCTEYMANAIGNYVSSTELESNTKRLLRLIKDKTRSPDTWLTRADITKAFQGVQARTRLEIISSLVERGEIVESKDGGQQGRPRLRYRAIFS